MGLTKVEREQRAAARAKQEAEREAERLLIAEEQALILAISRHYGLLLNDNTPRPDYDEEFDPGWGLPPSRFDALRHLMAGEMAAMGRRSHWFDRALLVDTPEARKAARREKHRGGPSDPMRLTGARRTSVCGSVRSTYRVLTCALIAAPAADEYPQYPPCAHCLRILRRRAQAWEEGKTPEGEARAAREAASRTERRQRQEDAWARGERQLAQGNDIYIPAAILDAVVALASEVREARKPILERLEASSARQKAIQTEIMEIDKARRRGKMSPEEWTPKDRELRAAFEAAGKE